MSPAVIGVYIRAMGGLPNFLLLAAWFLMCEAARVGATVWLSHWTGAADRPGARAAGLCSRLDAPCYSSKSIY